MVYRPTNYEDEYQEEYERIRSEYHESKKMHAEDYAVWASGAGGAVVAVFLFVTGDIVGIPIVPLVFLCAVVGFIGLFVGGLVIGLPIGIFVKSTRDKIKAKKKAKAAAETAFYDWIKGCRK